LLARFVETHHGALGVVRPVVDLQHVLHRTDEIGVLLGRNHPLPIQPGLQFVFFQRPKRRLEMTQIPLYPLT
jgi:hypothetical protein